MSVTFTPLRGTGFMTAALFAIVASTTRPCDTWVALGDATADGSVILGKNSDRPPMEAQVLVQMPRTRHAPGARVKCTYIEIPQVAETFETIGSKIWWLFGYEQGMNENGVAIGNEAVWSKESYEEGEGGDGLLGMDLVRLGLERGRTAHDALVVMTTLLEKYGQNGDAEHAGEWGKAHYHNSFILADAKEAWVLETAGKYWAAKRLTRGVYSISNIYSIGRDWDAAHADLVPHAIEKGWAKSAETFDFARAYGHYWTEQSRNPGNSQLRRNQTYSCLKTDAPGVTPSSMMRINRSHFEGTIAEARWGAAETFWMSPCMHDNPKNPYHTAASMVAQLRVGGPPLLRQVYWASFSNPCSNVFQPFYLNGPSVPERYSRGTSQYSENSTWWKANRVKLLCDMNYEALAPDVRRVFDGVERWELERQGAVEAEARQLLVAGDDRKAIAVLQHYVDENGARIDHEYDQLNLTLPNTLKTSGAKYLYLSYLEQWTSSKAVPLPSP